MQRVDGVDAGAYHAGCAADHVRVFPPFAEAGPGSSAQLSAGARPELRLRQNDGAQGPFPDQAPSLHMSRMVPKLKAHAQFDPVALAGVHHVQPFVNGQRHGLLHQNVLPGLGGHLGVGTVEVVGRGYEHRVNPGVAEYILQGVVSRQEAVLAGKLLRPPHVSAIGGDELRVLGQRHPGGACPVGIPSRPDECPTYRHGDTSFGNLFTRMLKIFSFPSSGRCYVWVGTCQTTVRGDARCNPGRLRGAETRGIVDYPLDRRNALCPSRRDVVFYPGVVQH